MQTTEDENKCPECGCRLSSFELGSSAGMQCTQCDWMVVTTNHNTFLHDSTLYTVWAEASTLDRSHFITGLAITLSLGTLKARQIVDTDAPIAESLSAHEVIMLRDKLAPKKIFLRVEPAFPW